MPRDTAGLGSSPFDRLYWGNRYYFLLLPLLRCFSSRRSPHALRDDGIAPAGLPHSDIRGSMGICPSPRLFAACHVLLRLREPRHPPCALVYVPYSLLDDKCLHVSPSPSLPDGNVALVCSTLCFSRSRFERTKPLSRFHHVIVLFPGSPWQS